MSSFNISSIFVSRPTSPAVDGLPSSSLSVSSVTNDPPLSSPLLRHELVASNPVGYRQGPPYARAPLTSTKVTSRASTPMPTLLSPSLPNSPALSNSRRATHKSSLVHRRGRGTYPHNTSLALSTSTGDILAPSNIASPIASNDECWPESDVRADRLDLCTPDVRRRKIVESEQRRRNDLRGGFARLKDALPVSREKCSKMVLLDRAATYIRQLEATIQETGREVRGSS
ncbi:helix loop helix DNA-binding domain protein [Ceratobasidium sp. AG-Ba]|nr:helix loop helix DNA-binding domain protein [Ceratobasidium sp. AG-Ba]